MRRDKRGHVVQEMRRVGLDWLVVAPSTNLEYLTGIKRRMPAYTRADHHGSWSEMALLSAGNELWYIAPRMVADFEAVDGEATEILRLEEAKAIEPQLKRILSRIGFAEGAAAVENEVSGRALLALQHAAPRMDLREGTTLMQAVRRVKSEDELDRLRAAARITDDALGDVLGQLAAEMSEWEVAAELDFQVRRRGAEAISFPTVVYGFHEASPSSIRAYREPRFEPLREGTVIAFDFGCVVDGYCSDFGRTVVLGKASERVEEYAEAVAEAHLSGIGACRAGATAASVHKTVRQALDESGVGQHFVHRTGHGIGMDVHEDPSLDDQDLTLLEEGMVLTVEPSVLVDGGLWVRNEDVVVVGRECGESLTQFQRGLLSI